MKRRASWLVGASKISVNKHQQKVATKLGYLHNIYIEFMSYMTKQNDKVLLAFVFGKQV